MPVAQKMDQRARVQIARVVGIGDLASATDEGRVPSSFAGAVVEFIAARAGRQRAQGHAGHVRGLGQDLLHPRVGLEGRALRDADRGELAKDLRVLPGARFALHD
jgi:hypothetical protein